MKRWALWTSFGAAVWGAVFSILSTTQHLRIAREGLQQASFCAISDTINCDLVNASSYSEFLGVPIAWWGLCYYFALGLISLMALRRGGDRRPSVAAAWFMSMGGILYSAFLAYIAFVVLSVICIECIAMYMANMVLFVCLFMALGIPLGGAFRFVRDYVMAVLGKPSNLGFKPRVIKQAIGIGAVFLVGWITIATITAGERKDGPTAEEMVRAFYMQSMHDIEVDPSWAVWGNPDAKVTIVEFSEYQCPFCRMAAFTVKPYLREFRDDVRYFFVNYPLDSTCNEKITRPMHPLACYTARAGICAEEAGRFWKFHDELFRNQSSLTRDKVVGIAASLGIPSDEFRRCIDSPETDARLREELAAGDRAFVTGTPALFLDGRKLKYWRNPKFLRAVVREEIERQR